VTDDRDSAPAVRRGAGVTVTPRLVFRAAVLVLGFLIGRSIAYQVSRGGLEAAIGGGLWVYGTLFVLVILFAFVGIRARIRRRPVGATLRPLALSSLIFVGAAIVGNVTAAFTGGLHREAQVLEASGTITLRLDGVTGFVAAEGSPARCASLPDGMDVAGVTGLELGLLGTRHLRGSVSLPFGNEADAHVELWIDGADLPEGAAQPVWTGPVMVSVRPGEDRPGQATFDSLPLVHNPDLPPYGEPFPETLAGSLVWNCTLFSAS
jgi:hypothetical protein